MSVSDPEGDSLSVTFYGRRITTAMDFVLAIFGDTQNYYSVYQSTGIDYFKAQAQWIAANRAAKNFAYVAHMGDVTNNNLDPEWVYASNAMSFLEDRITTGLQDGIPFGVEVGNHDQRNSTTAPYNQYFGSSRYAGRDYYGGHYGSNNNNYYELFSAGGMDFVVIYLEFGVGSKPDVLNWADQLLKQYINRHGIVVSHELLYPGDPAPWYGNGEPIYNALKNNPNLFLMLCGHAGADYKRSDVYNGNTVYTIMTDYSGDPNGGNGNIRLLNISRTNNNIHATTYSPTAGDRKASPIWDLPFNSFPVLGVTLTSGPDASLTWNSLATCSQYEWYVTVRDSQYVTTGPTWTFATVGCSINGNVTNGLGAGIAGATVSYSGGSTTTDAAGNFTLSSVSPGTYAVTASASGYQNSTQTVTVTLGQSAIANFALTTGGASNVTLLPTSLTFSDQLVGATSPSQSVTLHNGGSTAVTIGSVGTIGDFSLTNHCGSSLAGNSSCTIDVSFVPSAAGTRHGTLTVTESSPVATQTVTLTGTGVLPMVSLSPTSLSFANQALNSTSPAQTVTLTNNGNTTLSISDISIAGTTAFRFASWGDAQDGGGYVYATSNKIAALNPAFTIFNGDFSNDGVILSPATSPDSMQVMSNAMRGNPDGIGSNDNGIFSKTFLDRGNHDDQHNNPGDWQTFFASYPEAQGSMSARVARMGGSNYSYMSGQDNLTYSFDYKNSRFLMVDVPGESDNLTSSEVTWIDQRLTDAETNHPELVHAFISFHGPLYCVSYHCSCAGQRASCLSSAASSLVTVINKHPIVSALFNGHEHNLGWTHLDSTRISNLTHPVEQFMTSPSGSPTYNNYVQFDQSGTPYRFDYVETSIEDQSFGIIDINGSSYTVSLYREGTGNPVWSHSFSKSGSPGDGTGITDFSQTNTCGSSVAAGASCTINVTFTPTATGTRTASLSISDDASDSPQTVSLSGTGEGAPAPVVSLSPASLSFVDQALNTASSPRTLTLSNTGNAALTINGITVTGANAGDFAQSNNCATSVAIGANCTISVTFTPTGTGARSAALSINNNAADSPQMVSMTGTGTAPVVGLSPTSLTFGNQALNNTSAAQAVTLSNTGSAALTINGISVTGANAGDFAQTNTCGSSVAAGASCTIRVTFTPTATGTRTAAVSIADSAVGSPQTVSLGGTGESAPAPGVSLSATSLSFNEQGLNTSSLPQAVTLTNSGTATLTVSGITASGDFAQTNNCMGSLSVGASCQINVTFTPTAAGTRSGTLTVTESSPVATQTVTLTGTGVLPMVSLSPTSLTFANQPLNTTSPAQTVTLTNNGNTALSISGISIAGTTAFRFASWSDAQDGGGYMYATSNKIATLNPDFTIFNGDLSRDGVILNPATSSDSMQVMSNAMRGNPDGIGSNDNGVFSKTFLDRGNGDNHYDNPGDWQTFFASYPEAQGSMSDRVARMGGSNYSYMSGQDNLNYSFDYKNSRFIMVDVPGSSSNLTSSEVTWIDQRLTDAETNHPELVHAFISMHGAFYCVSYNCSCAGQRASCLSSAASLLVPVINKHPIVSALFNGHDHNLGWTHLDSTRISNLTHPVEQFMTSPSGSSTYNRYVQFDQSGTPYRFDYVETSIEDQAFGIIDVSGSSYTVSLYREGTETPVWSHSFSKSGSPGDGTSSADFSQTNTCGSSVAAGGNCQINVTFTPTATGTRGASLTIADDASDSPQTVSLSGTGESTPTPVASLSPASLTFSSQALGTTSAAQAVTLSNTGNTALAISSISVTGANPGDFAQSNNCGNSVAAGSSCIVNVTFTPTVTGTRTAAVSIADNAAGSPQSVSLTGNGTSPSVGISPNSLIFPSQALNTTSSPQSVILTNSGTASLTITSITASGDFAQTNTCGSSVAVGSSCQINVTFTPTATGARTGTLTIADNAAGSPQTVSLTGTGGSAPAPVVSLSPAGLSFGEQGLNTTSSPRTMTLSNTGSATLTISGISIAGANAGDFAQSSNCGSSVAAGANCTISVTFTPTATGTRTAAVSIADNAAGSPQSVSLTGTGTSASVTISPTSLNFGNQLVSATSSPRTLTITNNGNGTLNISAVSITGTNAGDFTKSSDNCSGASVSPGNNCTVGVTFTPTATGTRTAAVSIADNAAGSPQSVSLTGTGENAPAPVVSLSPASLSFGDQALNTTSSPQTVTLTNSGTASLTITSVAAIGDFAQTNTCGSSVAAGSNCQIAVTFTPTATGARTGTLTITDNAAGSPQSVSLTGTGESAPAPVVSLAPTNLSFGGQTLNTTSSTRTVTLSNTGSATLTVSGVSIAGANAGDFAQSNNCGNAVAAGANCTVNVTFTPTATGTRSALLSISDNAAGSPQSVSLTGTGVLGALSVTSVSPNSLPAGASGTLKIMGANFVAGATVSFSGAGRAPTVDSLMFVSSIEIDVVVTTYTSGPKRDRPFDVTVINPDGSSAVLPGGFTVSF